MRELFLGLVCVLCWALVACDTRSENRGFESCRSLQAEASWCTADARDMPQRVPASTPLSGTESNTDEETDDTSDEAPDDVFDDALFVQPPDDRHPTSRARRLGPVRLSIVAMQFRGRPADAPEAKPPRC